MKITELKCSACGAVLKAEAGAAIVKCEYCGSQFTIEWNLNESAEDTPQLKPMPERLDYTPIPPQPEPVDRTNYVLWRIAAAVAGLVVVALIIWRGAAQFQNPGSKDEENKVSFTPQGVGVPGSVSETEEGLTGVLADFAEAVFGRPASELTEGELSQIQWLEIKSDIDVCQVGYSFENPMENPQAALTWIQVPRGSAGDNACDSLPAFTGLKMLKTGQTIQKKQIQGLPLQGISGYFDSLGEVAELVENPEDIRKIEINGTPVSMEGIDKFPALETLIIDSDELKEERLLVSADTLKTLSVDIYNGTMDFSLFGAMPWIEDLTVRCKNLKDIGFVRNMAALKAVRFRNGEFLTAEPLAGLSNLTELSLESCDELKDLSAVATLSGLNKLSLELPYKCVQPELGSLTNLTELSLKGFDTTGLFANMNGLEKLSLSSCTIGSGADFAGLTSLRILNCTSANARQEYGFLSGLPSLEQLDLHGTVTYGDISGLFNMPSLKSLNISNMECEIDFDNIGENHTLETLAIDHIRLYKNVSVSGGGGIVNVDWDDVDFVEHLDFLSRMKGLKNLSICENGLADLSFASSLEALQTIDFADNYVTELSPLSGLVHLRQVICRDNPISNAGVLGDSVLVVQ